MKKNIKKKIYSKIKKYNLDSIIIIDKSSMSIGLHHNKDIKNWQTIK